MTRRRSNFLLTVPLATVVAFVMLLGSARAGTPGPKAAAIENYVTDYMAKAGYPGVSIAITKGDEIVLAEGFGHDSTGAEMTARTPMPVASVSKSFTALAVLQLVESGQVELDEPVRTYLRDFEVADRRSSEITVRELLDQTSGITDRTFREKSLPQPRSLEGAQRRARDATLAVEPGARHYYTNTNYHLAARLVEVVAGQPFSDYLRTRVLEPLGMRDSGSIEVTPDDLPAQVPQGHTYLYGGSIEAKEPHRFVSGSDGLISNAHDMAQWLIMQNNGGVAANGTRLVRSDSVQAMRSRSDGQSYGLGWQQDQKGRWGHSGVWFTATAYQMVLPSGYGIAVMSNSGLGLGNEGPYLLADGLATIVEGGQPQQISSMRLYIDLVLGALTLLSVAFGVRNIRRARSWAAKRDGRRHWLTLLRLIARLLPLVLLIALPRLLGLLFGGGRDLTHLQLLYYSPALVIWSGAASVFGVIVASLRLWHLQRLRRVAN